MPWKAYNPIDERLKFVARLPDGEKMAPCVVSSGSHDRPDIKSTTVT